MKSTAIRCLAITLTIVASYVPVSGYACCPSSPAGISPDELIKMITQSAQQQHEQDLQMIYSLIAVSIALGGGIIAFGVILYKKRNLKTKPNLET